MAQRILSAMATAREPEEGQTIPARAGDFARNGAQRAVAFGLILEFVVEDRDDDAAIIELAGQHGSRNRQPRVPGPAAMLAYIGCGYGFMICDVAEQRFRHTQAQVGV